VDFASVTIILNDEGEAFVTVVKPTPFGIHPDSLGVGKILHRTLSTE